MVQLPQQNRQDQGCVALDGPQGLRRSERVLALQQVAQDRHGVTRGRPDRRQRPERRRSGAGSGRAAVQQPEDVGHGGRVAQVPE
ncbi:hypothetical protein [Streptomyces aurantiogriseus]|uniref:Uncharacterized protein n=1 Tax=Streptomyces aurantiogriseus TaxID=66870 RepID=A0A918FP11_9ACTN|nr:hypothetical protein [Streptomyces aurantiogriseus]GGR60834.1 hypothetical protein GCM10010251_92010 [Streptomyces aurantiogriseus]